MKKQLLVCVVALVFCPAIMASDLALYVGSPNPGWYDAAQVGTDADTIIAQVGNLFRDVSKFDDNQLADLGAWIDERTDDGKMDILWLNGTMPSVLYQFPNVNPDGSRAELWLDGGNMIINVADWFGYMSYEGGNRSADNGGTGAANILDLSSGVIVSADGTTLPVTAEGREYLPSITANDPVHSDRPIALSAVAAPWEVAAIFAGNATQADPVVIHNVDTDGYVAFINQANLGNSIADRGLTTSEFIGNWVRENVGLSGGGNPLARRPVPEDGAKLEQTWVNLSWKPGYYAVSHNFYIGDSFDDVSSATVDSPEFQGNYADATAIVGFLGFPVPGGLIPGTTYYWRVDEINDANAASPWKGEVWSFWIPPTTAYAPSPSDGVHYVLPGATLSWTKGFGAVLHYVQFGDNFDDVANAAGGAASPTTTFTPPALELGKTYYWRVDEFNPPTTVRGNVWSFTTLPTVPIADPSLVGWWTLDEGEGTTAVDWSGHGGNGSFVGDPQWVDGYQGTALEFDGGDFVNCGKNAAPGVTADFTLAAWVKMNPRNAGQYMGICGKLSRLGGNADYMGFALVRHSSNVFRLWVSDGDAANILGLASSDLAYTDTEWHHVAGVREGQLNMLYVDGARQAGGNTTGFVPSDLFFQIGRQYSNTTTQRLFKGKIDDVRIYNKALTADQIAQAMRGDTRLADNPVPSRDALLDIRDISVLTWSAGAGAVSHDVYLGADRDAVAGADNSAPEFQGNQAGTSLSAAGLVEFGGGDYYWRIDEIAAGGTVNSGTVWKFTVTDYLIVDNFELYNNFDLPNPASNTIFASWADGYSIPTNGALTAEELPPYAEQSVVHTGDQAMKYVYDTDSKICESTLTVAKHDWTEQGVTKLSLWFRGGGANAPEKMFVALNGTAVVYHDDPAAPQKTRWNEWTIDLQKFIDQGVDLANVTTLTIGFGTKNMPAAGGTGTVYFDDIALVR